MIAAVLFKILYSHLEVLNDHYNHGDILFENVEDFFTHLELITNDPLIIIRPATAEITISDENGLCSAILYIIVS